MSLRGNKRRVALLFHARFHGSFVWRSGEDQAWLDITPVGREFGSPDYQRLSILDTYSWGNITEQEAMRQLDVDRHGLVAMLEADGLELTDEVRASRRKAIDDMSTPHKIGDITAIKGIFGKTARTVSVEEMNPFHRKP